MKVRVLVLLSDGQGVRPPGDVLELQEEHAKQLVALGVVEWADENRVVPAAPETATLTAGEEQAAQPRARRRG